MRNVLRWVASGTMILAGCSSGAGSAFNPPGGDSDNPFDDKGSADGGTFSDTGTGGGGGGNAPCAPNKANYEIPGNGCDDDADGKVDNAAVCDTTLAANASAEDFARAMGICAKASEKGYGIVSAKYTRGYQRTEAPQADQHGVLSKFGNVVKPREGGKLGVLSTGYAQEYDGPGQAPFGGVDPNNSGAPENGKDWYGAKQGTGNGTAPPGFPKAATGCKQANTVNDVIDVVLELKAPQNASGFTFDFDFYSGEWPAYVCTEFNDGFIAYLTASGFKDNISFDKQKNPVSVNNGFFDRCTANVPVGCAGKSPSTSQCPGGASELLGTGYGVSGQWCSPFNGSNTSSVNGGATGWLTSQAPIKPGETFTLEFMIWDTGDGILDSSVLIDNFKWIAGQVTTSTDRPK
jgi:hypothetical protein